MTNKTKLLPKLIAMTPYELYKMQVKGIYDRYRVEPGKTFLPPDMGGPLGQRVVIESNSVLEVTDVNK